MDRLLSLLYQLLDDIHSNKYSNEQMNAIADAIENTVTPNQEANALKYMVLGWAVDSYLNSLKPAHN